MNNNIVSFNAVSTSKVNNIKNTSASKNIININLTNSLLQKQTESTGVFDEDIGANLGKNPLAEYTLEELLKEGLENKQEIEDERKREAEKKALEERKAKEKELEKLYEAREENNGFFHPKKEAAIEEQIKKLEAELNVPHKPDGWENFCDTAEEVGATAVTFAASTVEGIVDVGETIVDGAVQVGGGIIAYGVGLVDEDAGNAMKQDIQDLVAYDASGAMYDTFVELSGIDEDIAYGLAHTAGNFAGQVVGYAAITAVTGGAGTMVVGGLAAAGAAAESAYANGATFDEAMIVSTTAGVLGAASGGAMDKLSGIARGATTLKGVIGYTAAGAALGTAEPIINSAAEYFTYGNNDGKSYVEFMNESGGWTKIALGAGAGGLSTGARSLSSYNEFHKTEVQYMDDLITKGYDYDTSKNICNNRRTAYSKWYKECNKYGGWATDNIPDRFQAMDNASLALDSNDIIGAEDFWNLKGNKNLRVENPTYNPNQMKNLENIRNSGEVNIYLTESQYKDYKLGAYRDGVKFDGRIDSDGATRAYCTKLNPNQSTITSSSELGSVLGTGWADGEKIYKGTLNSSSVNFSSGLEASANPDWIPGGYTLSMKSPNNLGTPDLVVKNYELDPNNYKPIN